MTQPYVSPDGRWRWDGTAWVPNQPDPNPYAVQPSPAPYGGASGWGVPPAERGEDPKAIVSLVLSVLWLCGIGSLLAVVLGHLSRREAQLGHREQSGVARAGLVLGYLGLVATVVGTLVVASAVSGRQPGGQTSGPPAGPVVVALHIAGDAQQNYHLAKGTYATTLTPLFDYGYRPTRGVDVRVAQADADTYCLVANDDRTTYYLSTADAGAVTDDPCG